MKQVLVIGLGQFGLGLVKSLRSKNVEVVAVDIDEKRVQEAAGDVDQSLCMDATNEEALAHLSPGQRDVCICATGDQSKEAAIIATALLKQLGAKRIIARANDALHARILRLVGADEVVNPELEFGKMFSEHVVDENIVQQMLLGTEIVITEIESPVHFHDKNLIELNLREKFGANIVAVKRHTSGQVIIPDPMEKLRKGDFLVIVSKESALAQILREGGTDG